jgi:hypothetical protein
MLMHRITLVAVLVVFGSSLLHACECSNSTPIQKTLEKYSDRAVFTARVVHVIGRVAEWQGKRYSDVTLAVVHTRHWGLPWYWPKVVILDGQYPCDYYMAEGEEYLVSGWRGRYGVINVAGCSRTTPLKQAQVDLRTLDGSHCAAPGGTVVGTLHLQSDDARREETPYPAGTVTLVNSSGKRYSEMADGDGIFEFRHLPAGGYTLEPTVLVDTYRDAQPVLVNEGHCTGASQSVRPYILSGRIAGLKSPVWVSLIPVGNKANGSNAVNAFTLDDGRFFFGKVPPGEYLLGVNLTEPPTATRPFAPTYYPGTTDRTKARPIRIANERIRRSFDFAVARVDLAPVPFVVVLPDGSLMPRWSASLEMESPSGDWTTVDRVSQVDSRVLIGIKGRRHRIRADDGVKYDSEAGTEQCSDPTRFTLNESTQPIRVVLTHPCATKR